MKIKIVKPNAKLISSSANDPGHGFMCYYYADIVEVDLSELKSDLFSLEYLKEFIKRKMRAKK